MKKRIMGIASGAVILIVLFALYFFAIKWTPETEENKQEELSETSYLFESFSDDIVSIDFNYNNKTYTIHNGENKTISGYKSSIIDSTKITQVIHSFSSIIEIQNIESTSENLQNYGINDSEIFVVIKEKNGKSTKIILGSSALVNGEYYAYNENSKKLSSISGSVAQLFITDPSTYRSMEVCKISTATIERVAINKGNKKIIDIAFDDEKGLNADNSPNFKMLYPYKGVAASTDRMSALIETIGSITASEIVSEDLSNLKIYGLDTPYEVAVTDEEGNHTIYLGKKNDDGLVYLMYNDIKAIYLAECPFYEKVVNVNTYDYIDRFIHLVYLSEVSSIEFITEKENAVLKIEGDSSNDNAKYFVNDEQTRTDKFKELYQAVIGITATAIDDNFKPTGKEQCSITFNLKNNKKKTFKYYDYDERNYYVKADSGIGCVTLKKNIDIISDLLK